MASIPSVGVVGRLVREKVGSFVLLTQTKPAHIGFGLPTLLLSMH